jgi:hypothetical protein
MEMAEITIGFNNMCATKFHFGIGETMCTCGCANICCNIGTGGQATGAVACQVKQHTYTQSTHLWEQSLCPKPEGSDWHALKCVTGDCQRCVFHLIPLCEQEYDPTNLRQMEWRRFEMVSTGSTTKAGAPKKVVRLEYKWTPALVFLQHAAAKIPEFVLHQHTAHW